MEDSRKLIIEAHKIWFQIIYTDFLKDNKGFANPLSYMAGIYMSDDSRNDKKKYDNFIKYWAKIARKSGHRCIKRGGIYYFEA